MENQTVENKFKPINLIILAVTGILIAGIIGGVTNFVNATISDDYFRVNVDMHDIKDIPRASIAVGLMQGLITGVFFSLGFVIFIGLISKGSCNLLFGLKYLGLIIAGTLFFWLLGGFIGMGIGALSPEYILSTVNSKETALAENEVVNFMFAGGAIPGVNFGGFVSLVLGILIFRLRWKRLKKTTRAIAESEDA